MNNYDFDNIKYDPVRQHIKVLIDDEFEEENIRNLLMHEGISPEDYLKIVGKGPFPKDLTLEEWQGVYDHLKKRNKPESALLYGAVNDAKIPTNPGSQWQRYKKSLELKGFSENSINNLDLSSYQILQQLSKNTFGKDPIKGLVVGSVQSGKTANMIGLMSMAADYGFNFFIIFSGMIDSLRVQTENRMFEDLNLEGDAKNLDWTKISNPSLRNPNPETKWSNIHLGPESKNRYFTVALKNHTRMKDLKNWLYSNKGKTKQLKVLIIDDEADQASINTNLMDREDERTSINQSMIDIVNGYDEKELSAVNYISYTATPYANALNESEGLFPKDFVISLPLSEDYLGPKELFGLQEPEKSPNIPIVRTISERDMELFKDIHNGRIKSIPKSFSEAITWFFITSCIFRIYGYKSPVSMLIHTSHRVSDHDAVYRAVKCYLKEIQQNQEEFMRSAEILYNRETVDFTIDDFKKSMKSYSSKDQIKDYPKFELIKKQMKRVFNETGKRYQTNIPFNEDGSLHYHEGFHVAIDNSFAKSEDQEVRLIYPDGQKTNLAPMFIVIGGNTLSRGLTLEGLTSSYFLRNTIQADTLFQMGRWFGYRKGYELLPRVWLNSEVRERFQYISQINDELIETIEEMSIMGQRPKDLGIKVKNSPDNHFLRLTSQNKMQAAEASTYDFSGINKQTIIFEDSHTMLQENIDLTLEFLNKLGKENLELKGSISVWTDIKYQMILDYLSDFNFPERDIFFGNIDKLLEWFDKIMSEKSDMEKYHNWNIILATKSNISDNPHEKKFELLGKSFDPVTRSKLNDGDDEKVVSIGALRSPTHLLGDLDAYPISGNLPNKNQMKELRKKEGLAMVPQLILYVIDKNSKPSPKSKTRSPLNFSHDVVGMNLYIPGNETNKNIATSLSIKIDDVKKEEYTDEV